MCNVTLGRKANPVYQLAAGSGFSCRPPLAENYKGVGKTEVSAVTNLASILIALIAVHWYRRQLKALFCYSAQYSSIFVFMLNGVV